MAELLMSDDGLFMSRDIFGMARNTTVPQRLNSIAWKKSHLHLLIKFIHTGPQLVIIMIIKAKIL